MKRTILIGDSIRMGYEDTVRTELEGLTEVLSSKENGGNSRNVLAHFEEWVISQAPDVVHLNCGLHDLKKEFSQPEPVVSIEEYGNNIRQILNLIKSRTRATVIWVTTTPVNEQRHREIKGFDRFETDVRSYNAVAARIAEELDLAINDLFTVVEKAGKNNIPFADDGVHFTPEGYIELGKAVALFVKPYLKITQN